MTLNVAAIRTSFARIQPDAGRFVDRFYENLWGDYPDSRGLFAQVDMPRQKTALAKSLETIVNQLEDSDRLVAYLKGLGERHIAYGTEPPHYALVGASLLKTFREFLGEDWTPALEGEWTMAFGIIADVMQLGAREAAGKPRASRSPLKVVAETRTDPSALPLRVELPAELKKSIRTKVREQVKALINHEIRAAIAEEERALTSLGVEAYLKQVI